MRRKLLLLAVLSCVAVGCGQEMVDAPQLAISFLSPGIWQDVSGSTTLSVSVQSNTAVARVDHFLSPLFIEGGGEAVQQFMGSASTPFSLAWDTTQFPDGASLLQATVIDVNGNSATAEVPVNVLNHPCGIGPPTGVSF